MPKVKHLSIFLFGLVLLLLLAGCVRNQPVAPTPTPELTATPTLLAPTATVVPPTHTPTPEISALVVYCDPNLPPEWRQQAQQAMQTLPVMCVEEKANARMILGLAPLSMTSGPVLAQRFYAVVAPFATLRDDVSMAELQARWIGQGQPLLVDKTAAAPLSVIFGTMPAHTIAVSDMNAALATTDGAWGIIPFEQLHPGYKVLSIDGAQVLDKRMKLETYPLAVGMTLAGPDAEQAEALLAQAIQPATNRDTQRMSTLIMTGVTAMSRGTAEKMEQKGYLYPAQIISDTLSAADITHISNEVPFLKDCQVNNTYMNLILCSAYPYLQALEAVGVDIVGLSGNHVNDFGREGARESLQFYKEHHIPIYGSGLNEDEACNPLLWTANGNTYAFLAALAWWPEEAWATDTEPGACYYWRNRDKILDMIQRMSQQVDIVSVELQYHETYDPWPIPDQIAEFRALHEAGADIVTGVQSHVPQAVEVYGDEAPGGPAVILYGLGNLFFDQMQSWETRTALIPRHTIYQGRLLSTELLTTVLEDFAQPRWATPEERTEILRSIFDAAPDRNAPPATPASISTPAPAHTPEPEPTATPRPVQPATSPHPQPTPPPAGVAVLPWPQPQAGPASHFLISRPTGPIYNRMEDLGYAFGSTAGGRYRVHHGVDIANPTGTPLLAPAEATIRYAGPDDEAHQYGPYPNFYGNSIIFQLDQDWQGHTIFVLYGHLQHVQVTTGQHVTAGEQIGLTGMTGIALGPHVHVEIRLDTPEDYTAVYNTSLWMRPFSGYGVIAGRVLTADGLAWHGLRLHVYRLSGTDAHLYRVFSSYALDEGIRPDPVLAENAVLGAVPAGDYEIVLKYSGKTWRQRVHVNPGEIATFEMILP